METNKREAGPVQTTKKEATNIPTRDTRVLSCFDEGFEQPAEREETKPITPKLQQYDVQQTANSEEHGRQIRSPAAEGRDRRAQRVHEELPGEHGQDPAGDDGKQAAQGLRAGAR